MHIYHQCHAYVPLILHKALRTAFSQVLQCRTFNSTTCVCQLQPISTVPDITKKREEITQTKLKGLNGQRDIKTSINYEHQSRVSKNRSIASNQLYSPALLSTMDDELLLNK